MKNKAWTKLEEKYLIENYRKKTYRVLSEELGRTVDAIRYKAYQLKLTKGMTPRKGIGMPKGISREEFAKVRGQLRAILEVESSLC